MLQYLDIEVGTTCCVKKNYTVLQNQMQIRKVLEDTPGKPHHNFII